LLLDHTSGVFDHTNEGRVGDIDRLPDPQLRAEARSLVRRYADGEPVIVPDRLLVALAETHDRYDVTDDLIAFGNGGPRPFRSSVTPVAFDPSAPGNGEADHRASLQVSCGGAGGTRTHGQGIMRKR
jgi:hypothetical protein